MKTNKILVIGGKGKTGSRVVKLLNEKPNITIRLGSRSSEIPFDWEKPETWSLALKDIDSVYITFQPDLAIPSAPETIQKFALLATKLGVEKMVLLSGRGEKEAQICEEILKAAAQKWTIVRASWFNQNFSESIFLEPLLAGFVALPQANVLEPFIDANDIAEVVTEALLNDKHNGQTYELTGPRLLSFEQAVSEIAKVIKKEIVFESLTVEKYINMLREYQVPEDEIWLINYLFSEVMDGRNSSTTNDIEKVLGRKATDFSEFVKETAKTGVWNEVRQLS
ncbi:Rossmann-fold NAD(P)-binding domain-containing protein [Flavobacterium fluviale]|uniref:NmrA family transcriptional regulator n=1 Tax=Flavobacterium fluviale TaxID=2249356 RepID=A0A344LXF7_9FLAO|nr:NmrA family transcriptional regulator [Flavobacterium fluviale]AXB58599.1 NmrA family transcriptional regulator [Flavobacterium fluviale]